MATKKKGPRSLIDYSVITKKIQQVLGTRPA
jgi:hypothetical protein